MCDSRGFELEMLLLPYDMIATMAFVESMTLEMSCVIGALYAGLYRQKQDI